MGCYDTVTFRCPKCRNRLSEHSKAGECSLLAFDSGSVPLAVAADLQGTTVECVQCFSEWVVKLDAPGTVRMYLEQPETEDD